MSHEAPPISQPSTHARRRVVVWPHDGERDGADSVGLDGDGGVEDAVAGRKEILRASRAQHERGRAEGQTACLARPPPTHTLHVCSLD